METSGFRGKARTIEPKSADDHDTEWQASLVPFGILNTQSDQLSIYMGQSAETTDLIVDCLTEWWHNNQSDYTELEELVINLDGGPAIRNDVHNSSSASWSYLRQLV